MKVFYVTPAGQCVTFHTCYYESLEKRLRTLFRRHIEARAVGDDGKEIGRVWQDKSQKPQWNWHIDKPQEG